MSEEEKQICPSCGYPAHAGHAKTCKTRTSEEVEDREQGYELFVKFLEKHGIDKMTAEDKVKKIKELNFDEIMQIISRINGRLAFRDKKQEWSGKAVKSRVSGPGGDALEPPDGPEVELQRFFEEMKENISVDNLGDYASKTFLAIIFSHAFENGNGRTARNIYHLLRKDGVPPETISTGRPEGVVEVCGVLSQNAMTVLYEKRGIQIKFKPKEMERFAVTFGDDDWPAVDDMSYIKFLAARDALQETGVDVSSVESINLDRLTDEQKNTYDKKYKDLKQEWFWEVIKMQDEFPEYVNEKIDTAVLKT